MAQTSEYLDSDNQIYPANAEKSNKNQPKSNRSTVSFSATAAEKRKIAETAKKLNVNVSNFLRWRSLNDSETIDLVYKENIKIKKEIERLKINENLHFSDPEKTTLLFIFGRKQIDLLFERLVGAKPRSGLVEIFELNILKQRILDIMIEKLSTDDNGEVDENEISFLNQIFEM